MSEHARLVLVYIDFEIERLEARQVHARVERGRVVLPRDLRSRFLRGDRPAVTTWGREPCPIKPGMTYRLAPNLTLVFQQHRRHRKGHHRVDYVVQDFRPLTLRTRPSDSDARRKDRQHWSAEEEHGYSHSQDALDAGDVLSPVERQEQELAARTRATQQGVVNKARREVYELGQRLDRVRERAALERIDISSDERVIRKRIEALERKVLDKAA